MTVFRIEKTITSVRSEVYLIDIDCDKLNLDEHNTCEEWAMSEVRNGKGDHRPEHDIEYDTEDNYYVVDKG